MSVATPRLDPFEDRLRLTASLLIGGSLLVGVVAGQLVAGSRGALVLGFGGAVVPVLLWLKPEAGPVLLVATALTVEQFPEIGATGIAGATARIPIFHGLGGVRISDLLLCLLVAFYLAKRGTSAANPIRRSPLSVAMAVFVATAFFGLAYGLGTGGVPSVAMNEARPYIYLALAFVATAGLVTKRSVVRGLLWAFVLGTGVKACQGVLLFLSIRGLYPRPDAVLGHEESLFFALFLLLVMALWLYDLAGPLRRTATALAPVVIAADLGNGRRTAWLILAVGMIAILVAGIAVLPKKRSLLAWFAAGALLFSAVYFPAYWNKNGGFAQPARAFRSAVAPDARDSASNLYRTQEEANLRLNIARAGPLGRGFGHPIDYALPIVDISDIDPYIAYVSHNGVSYLMLRLGIAGSIAFWALLGIAIITACRVARYRDKELAVLGMLTVCALPAYAVLGYNDQGFYFYRVAIVMGVLLGFLQAARHLAVVPVGAPETRPRLTAPLTPRHAPPRVAPQRERIPRQTRAPARAEPRPTQRRSSRPSRLAIVLLVVGVANLVFGFGLLAWFLTAGGLSAERTPPPARPAPAEARAPSPATVPVAPAPVREARLHLTGLRHGSWIQVRRGSAGGPVLFDGVLDEGDTRLFRATRLWVRFGAAGNLTVALNGRTMPLAGTLDKVFTARDAKPR